MVKVPRRFSHFLYGVIQSGLTCAIASAIASFDFIAENLFLVHWIRSWLLSWALMLPIVVFAAPMIRWVTLLLTYEDAPAIDR